MKTVKPEDLLVIFDVDGTLTDEGEPSGKKASPRGNSIQLVQGLKAKGVHLVASSAWDDFKSVMVRVDQLGLTDCFIDHSDAKAVPSIKIHKKFTSPEDDKSSIDVFISSMGRIVSVMDPAVDDEFYREKALAPYFIHELHEKILKRKIRKVIFIDDSSGNCGLFRGDVERLKLYHGIDWDDINIGDPETDPPVH